MDNNLKVLLDLYACAINGCEPSADITFDFEEVVKIADNQGLLAIIMPVLKKIPFVSERSDFKSLYSKYLIAVVNNSAKTEKLKSMLKSFEDNGINYCVLKGESLARLYAVPETRISGDTDILVSENDENKALSILVENDFNISHRTQASNHDVCTHPQLGCIELHVKLYYDFMEDIWFDNISMIEEEYIDNDGIKTLGYTDGYLYVFLHAVKHFISGGLSIRHFSDILLYAEKHKDKIDFARVDYVIKKLKYDGFENFVFCIGEKYLNISGIKGTIPIEKSVVEDVFDDMLKGGIFGKNDRERARFFEIYNEQRFSVFKDEDFGSYMTNWRRKNAKKVISFSKGNIIKRYPYAQKSVFCYAGAMAEHTFFIIKKALKRKKLVKDVISYKTPDLSISSQKRLELLKKMNMI